MKKKFLIISALIIIVLLLSVLYFKGTFKSNPDKVKIKNISLVTRVDTISYALGSVWATNIKHFLGYHNMTYAFYLGVHDYLKKDSSKMGMYWINNYLQNHGYNFKFKEKWPVNDSNIRICDIQLKTKFDTFSYSLGFAWCSGAYGIGITEVTPSLLLGLLKGLKGDTSLFRNYTAANIYLMSYVEEQRFKKFGDIKKVNEDWLKVNGRKEGVKTLPSGVQYKILKSGNGISPNVNDVAECNYIGKLIDGKVFDSTYQSGPPLKFYVGSVMKGWLETLQLMKEGDKWEIYIPYKLAYGSGGVKDMVPEYSTVILEVELVKVTKQEIVIVNNTDLIKPRN